MTGVRENCDGLTKAVPEMGRRGVVGGGEVEVRGAHPSKIAKGAAASALSLPERVASTARPFG